MPEKPHRIRVRVLDGRSRTKQDLNKLKSSVLRMPHLDIVDAQGGVELIICAAKEAHLAQLREKLGGAGLEEIEGGDTAIPASASLRLVPQDARRLQSQRHGQPQSERQQPGGTAQDQRRSTRPDLCKKPYGFVPLPETFTTDAPVWHDGTSSADRLSGEIRFELETLTPLLVGWERGIVGDKESDWPVPENLDGVGPLAAKKSVLCPLRAPWGQERPVIIPGDTLKGLLRHELGALLGAPMERVADRSYSYRPNALYPNLPDAYLVPRLARVRKDGVNLMPLELGKDGPMVRVPTRLELLPDNLKYDKRRSATSNYYRFDDLGGAPYRGGQGAGQRLNSKRPLHETIAANPSATAETVDVPQTVQQGYLATIRHLIDLDHGHFSQRHPDFSEREKGEKARKRILKAAQKEVFQPGDMIWVEWDTKRKRIVSLGWHYYYRWAYTDTVRKKGGASERPGLFPLPEERTLDAEGAPHKLSPVRRLFGYTGDNDGSGGIGKDDYAQLMGRISINAGLEVIEEGDTEHKRFLPPTFLKELGMPRPSAVEFYLKQPHHPKRRPSDRATLVTYGDAAGYDEAGELAGRKFYLDRTEAYSRKPWKDDSPANRDNERSTLALEASQPGRRFRFTLRFRDLDPTELAAILVAFCPHQFRTVLDGQHLDGYCSKLGYARPLGWGSVRIEAKGLFFLKLQDDPPAVTLESEPDIPTWVRCHFQRPPLAAEWLAVHRHKHPDAADYPRDGNKNIYTFHTDLRARHSRDRRYPR